MDKNICIIYLNVINMSLNDKTKGSHYNIITHYPKSGVFTSDT